MYIIHEYICKIFKEMWILYIFYSLNCLLGAYKKVLFSKKFPLRGLRGGGLAPPKPPPSPSATIKFGEKTWFSLQRGGGKGWFRCNIYTPDLLVIDIWNDPILLIFFVQVAWEKVNHQITEALKDVLLTASQRRRNIILDQVSRRKIKRS